MPDSADREHAPAPRRRQTSVIVRPISAAASRPLRRRVLRPAEALEELAAHEPSDPHTVGAFAGGRLVGVGMIGGARDGEVWRVRGMAVEPELRGRGVGGAVLDALIAHAAAEGAVTVWCNARTPALSFYERAGFTRVSGEFEIPGIGPHHRMERRMP